MGKSDLLAHRAGDHVAVAVMDLDAGTRSIRYLDESAGGDIEVAQPVPLGHKIALQDLASNMEVVEYGTVIGRTTREIKQGEHVHVHNLKGQRWS